MIEKTSIRQIKQLFLKRITVEFFWISHIDLTVFVEKKKMTIENFEIWFFENSNICFDNVTNETKNNAIIVDFFVVLHIKLIALIEKRKFSTIFEISWLRIYSYNFLLKLKFYLQSLQIIRTHVTFWFDTFFIDFNMIFDVAIEKFKQIDKMISRIVNEICEICKMNVSMIVDFFSISHIDLIVTIEKNEQNFENFWTKFFWCFDSNVWKDNDFDEINKHWIDMFFINSDTISNALNMKCEYFDKMIASKIIDSNICFDVAIEISNFYEIDESNEQMTIEFFSISHIDLTVLIEKNELLTNFFACCSRTCFRNFSLKLKFESQRIQMIFAILIFANETFAKSTRNVSIHSFNDVDFMIVCLSNQISKTKFQRQANNNVNKFDFRYWCWHCWKCCKNFSDSLNRRFSHVNVESKISIFWNVDVDFAICSIFDVFDLTRLAFFIALNLIFFAIFKAFDFCNFCCFWCSNEINEMIKTKIVEFSIISFAYFSKNCKTNSYVCWFWTSHKEYWKRYEFQIS